MAPSSTRLHSCSSLLVAATLLVLLGSRRHHALAWQYCEDDDIFGIYGHCGESVRRKGPPVPPSPLCCSFIADAEKVACVCRHLVSRGVEKHMSVPRLVKAARGCGATIEPGIKCGSYVAPDYD